MAACSKHNQLVGIFEIRLAAKVFVLQSGQVHQHFPGAGFPASGEILASLNFAAECFFSGTLDMVPSFNLSPKLSNGAVV